MGNSQQNVPYNTNEEQKVSYNTDKEQEETIELYTIISGKIKESYVDELNKYQISDPNSEEILEYCDWEDYRNLDAYKNCIVKNSDYYRSVTQKYSLNDLECAIKKFESKNYYWHVEQMNKNYQKMKSEKLSIDEKKACALVLSYYTGFKDNSDRSSRNTNVLIRGLNSTSITKNWNDGEHFYPVIYYLTKAISSLPFYWGYTLRCVHLTKKQAFSYKPGTIVTWLQWSSSKIGTQPTNFFAQRNTWFYIYSFSSREISQFSVYSEEKEALYPPFSHFLVFKNEIKNSKHHIYMRQIEIGLYPNNILWVDDNILNSDWENKKLMEIAYYNSKILKIIPKISTETALAFLRSFKPFINSGTVKYKIISDMTRNNEYPSENAGARFVKSLQDSGFSHLEVMIFTSSKDFAENELKKLNVIMNKNIKVTTLTNDAINFLCSD